MIEPTSSTPGGEHVTIREFESYQKALANESALVLRLIEQHQNSVAADLKLQATEYERRLADLNNSHEKAIQVQATYVSKEALRLETDDLKRRVDLNANALVESTLAMTRLTATVASIDTAVGALITSQTWLTRLVVGAVVVALLALVFGGSPGPFSLKGM